MSGTIEYLPFSGAISMLNLVMGIDAWIRLIFSLSEEAFLEPPGVPLVPLGTELRMDQTRRMLSLFTCVAANPTGGRGGSGKRRKSNGDQRKF